MTGTRKVVINACFGGFTLSWEAMNRIAARKGLVASYFSLSPETHAKVYGKAPVDPDDSFTHRVIGPRSISKYPDGDDAKLFISDRELGRDDSDVVAAVEELGEAASGKLSRLKVVEVPADVEYSIEEYDGNEHVAEAHRVWH